jgi:hypothetical protein
MIPAMLNFKSIAKSSEKEIEDIFLNGQGDDIFVVNLNILYNDYKK